MCVFFSHDSSGDFEFNNENAVDIQGLIALTDDSQSNAVYINWACTSPENNVWRNGSKLYEGVGGHLFAIAINVSEQRGHGDCVHAIAIVIGIMHPYHFVIGEESARKIKEVYKYECLMKNFNVSDSAAKDKIAQDFIKAVNPYRTKPFLGIDLRRLAKYAKESRQNLSTAEIQKFKMN